MPEVTIIEITPFENLIIEVPEAITDDEGFDYVLDLVLS